MSAPDSFLPISDPATLQRARRWLLLGIAALGVAGIFAGMLGSTKSDYFYTALVVHVDLSVLVWFLTLACMFFTLAGDGRGWGMVADAAFWSFAGGMICIVLSGFTGGMPYMSNYIPVIHHPVFFIGLGLLFSGVSLATLNFFFSNRLLKAGPHHLGIGVAILMMASALFLFVITPGALPPVSAKPIFEGQAYYDTIFWSGGHVLQFVHTQLMMVAWFWLASAAGLKINLSKRQIKLIYKFGLLPVAAGLIAGYIKSPAAESYRIFFTDIMKYGNGIAPLVLGGFIAASIVSSLRGARSDVAIQPVHTTGGMAGLPRSRCSLAMTTLIMSLILFAAGGGLGYRIAGSNVTVPAHYHGSIVGVTLAYMGVAYLLLPAFGWADISRNMLAIAQPVVYGGGQLCWMTGMAILGAHGVPRKTPGSADMVGAFASFLKHGGDGLALIGGLLFVFIVLKSAFKKQVAYA